MDLVGIAMGLVTIPMALLTVAGLLGGLTLLLVGDWPMLGLGLLALGIGVLLAAAIERATGRFDAAAVRVARRDGRSAGLCVGTAGALVPMAIILAWEWQALTIVWTGGLARAAFAYLVGTGPWTVFAIRERGDRRTLSAIRAYAAHLSFWAMAATREWLGLPALAPFAAIVPAILPVTVGALLAVADRDALRNVRI